MTMGQYYYIQSLFYKQILQIILQFVFHQTMDFMITFFPFILCVHYFAKWHRKVGDNRAERLPS